MESPGKLLKASRESQNLSLKEVSERTKIREHLPRAIEEDRYEILKYPAYLKGFLKTYAKSLGLNPDDVVGGYQKYLESMILFKEPETKRRPTVSRKKLALWLVAIFIFITVLFIGIFLNYTYQFLPFPGKKESSPTPLPPVPPSPPLQKGE
jgi:cytoskeleton protein RodZ